MAKPTKTRKYTTKKMSDGSQQYTRSGVSADTLGKNYYGKKNTGGRLGKAAASAFIDRGAKEKANQFKGTLAAKSRKGKPMGGK